MKELIDQLHAAWNDLWSDLSSSTDDLTEIGRLVAEIKKMADESFDFTGRSAKYQPSDETERMSHPGTRSA